MKLGKDLKSSKGFGWLSLREMSEASAAERLL